MRAGDLREVITIHRAEQYRTDNGEVVEVWKQHLVTRAQRRVRNGSRVVVNDAIFYSYTIEFLVRDNIDVSDIDQITAGAEKYRILSVVRDLDKHAKVIVAEKIQL